MGQLFTALEFGIKNFPLIAMLVFLPMLIYQLVEAERINLSKIVVGMLFLFYMLCAYGLVIFPLPDAQTAAALASRDFQLIPFQFVADIVRASSFNLKDVSTYLPAIFSKEVQQVVLNVLMTVPFGMFLKYLFNLDLKQALLFSLGLSLFFELTQLTGLYFIYSGSYRLFDVDDLLANTLGGFVGFALMSLIAKKIPSLESFGVDIFSASSNQGLPRVLSNHTA